MVKVSEVMPEKLHTHRRQRGRESFINCRKRTGSTIAQFMNVARNQFLAGAGLADDEGRRIAGTDPLHTIQQCLGRRVFNDQATGPDREGQCVRVRSHDVERCLNTHGSGSVGYDYRIVDCSRPAPTSR